MKTFYLGGGCFWCTEAIFQQVQGVTHVLPGYMGGSIPNPSYEAVCSGTTGHAEVIEVGFDPSAISLSDLLDIFFEIHDPTTLNRQGNDVGTQYRSIIFYTEEEQRPHIIEAIDRAQQKYTDPIRTDVATAQTFYVAEAYHRDYYLQHRAEPYCQLVISPKLEKFLKTFPDHRT